MGAHIESKFTFYVIAYYNHLHYLLWHLSVVIVYVSYFKLYEHSVGDVGAFSLPDYDTKATTKSNLSAKLVHFTGLTVRMSVLTSCNIHKYKKFRISHSINGSQSNFILSHLSFSHFITYT